jgi:hypothetical protein
MCIGVIFYFISLVSSFSRNLSIPAFARLCYQPDAKPTFWQK